MNNETFYITGGAGFVGYNLSRCFSKATKVFSIDYTKHRTREENIKNICLDLRENLSALPKLNNGIMIHAAALMNADNQKDIWDINVGATKNLFEWSIQNRIEHFIFISSGAVYGYDKGKEKKEYDSLKPIGEYGFTKLIGENIAKMYSDLYDLPVTVIRLYFPYGSGQKSGIFPLISRSIRNGNALTIKKDGAPLFKPIHIEDLVNAIGRIAKKPDGFKIYNLCGDDIVSFLDVVRMMEKEYGREANLIFSEDDEGDLLADNSKIKQELGWKSKTGIRIGIREFVRFENSK